MATQPKVFVSMDKNNIEAYTPKYAVDILIPFLDKSKVIWAPFCAFDKGATMKLKEIDKELNADKAER